MEVVTAVFPVDLLDEERKRIYEPKQELGVKASRRGETTHYIKVAKWDGEKRGRLAARLIPNVKYWLNPEIMEKSPYISLS